MLVAAEGLDDPAQGVVVDFSGETPVVTDGPYGETKELFGGFYVIDVASREEAVEWAKRLPAVGRVGARRLTVPQRPRAVRAGAQGGCAGFANEGLSTYTHVTDQHTTYGTKIIVATKREAHYVLDEIIGNASHGKVRRRYPALLLDAFRPAAATPLPPAP